MSGSSPVFTALTDVFQPIFPSENALWPSSSRISAFYTSKTCRPNTYSRDFPGFSAEIMHHGQNSRDFPGFTSETADCCGEAAELCRAAGLAELFLVRKRGPAQLRQPQHIRQRKLRTCTVRKEQPRGILASFVSGYALQYGKKRAAWPMKKASAAPVDALHCALKSRWWMPKMPYKTLTETGLPQNHLQRTYQVSGRPRSLKVRGAGTPGSGLRSLICSRAVLTANSSCSSIPAASFRGSFSRRISGSTP